MPARSEDTKSGSQAQVDTGEPDSALQDLQDVSFDPVEFLNASLPQSALSLGPQYGSRSTKPGHTQETSSLVQDLLGKLNAQNIRYSNTLTRLTDDILRSGSRLAYEVEILRGDANGLHDVLTDTLQHDIQKLILDSPEADARALKSEAGETTKSEQPKFGLQRRCGNAREPDFVSQLRLLSQVKTRLEEVIGVFGEAMEWPLPPSEMSLTSSLISVSAPAPGPEKHTREEKASDKTRKIQSEIISLLDSEGGGYEGLEAADVRVESLKSLAEVWKGTVEEKARVKFVDGLTQLVDDRRRVLEARTQSGRSRSNSASQRSSSMPGRPSLGPGRIDRNAAEANGGGLLRNLQRLRDEIYLD